MAEQKRDYYEVLGVDKNADDAAIKKAYRVLAKKYNYNLFLRLLLLGKNHKQSILILPKIL